jgi:hypothetical protein
LRLKVIYKIGSRGRGHKNREAKEAVASIIDGTNGKNKHELNIIEIGCMNVACITMRLLGRMMKKGFTDWKKIVKFLQNFPFWNVLL